MNSNLTKIASLPQGGGSKAALVGEVQSRAAMSEETRSTFDKISDPANAHLFSLEAMREAFGLLGESGPELNSPNITINVTTAIPASARAEIARMIAASPRYVRRLWHG